MIQLLWIVNLTAFLQVVYVYYETYISLKLLIILSQNVSQSSTHEAKNDTADNTIDLHYPYTMQRFQHDPPAICYEANFWRIWNRRYKYKMCNKTTDWLTCHCASELENSALSPLWNRVYCVSADRFLTFLVLMLLLPAKSKQYKTVSCQLRFIREQRI